MLGPIVVDVARLGLWLAILAAIFVPLERLFALRPARLLRPGIAADLGFYFMSGLIPALLLGLPMAAVATVAHRIVPNDYYLWIGALPLWARLVAALIVGEIGFYWGHRWTHQWPWLWRFHAVHHRPDHLDWMINSRAHPIDLLFVRLCGLVPLYVSGLAQPDTGQGSLAAVLVVLAATVWGFFLHANIRWRLGPIEHIVASPRFHHWHHVLEGPADRNFSATLPILDRLFGTLHLPPKAWPEGYGIAEQQPSRVEKQG